jgi:hypothetical protein
LLGYNYEHLDAFISWFYTEKQAQIDKAVIDQTNLEQTVKDITDPKFAIVEDEIYQHDVTNLFYNAGLKTVNLDFKLDKLCILKIKYQMLLPLHGMNS